MARAGTAAGARFRGSRPGRRFLKLVEYRLEKSLLSLQTGEPVEARYSSVGELRSDLEQLNQSILTHRGKRIADEIVQPWIDLVDTFGFHFASLEIRQNSEAHRQCLLEVLQQVHGVDDSVTDEQLRDMLTAEVPDKSVDTSAMTEKSRDVFETFLLVADEVRTWGLRPIGGYIISMTHTPVDVLTVLWLWKAAWQATAPGDELPHLRIIPLFETIDDLQHAPAIMDELFQIPAYAEYLASEFVAPADRNGRVFRQHQGRGLPLGMLGTPLRAGTPGRYGRCPPR